MNGNTNKGWPAITPGPDQTDEDLLVDLGRAFSGAKAAPGRAADMVLEAAVYVAVLRGQQIAKARRSERIIA